VPVQPSAIGGQEDWSFAARTDGQVDRPGGARRERDSDDLATLAGNHLVDAAADIRHLGAVPETGHAYRS
jgi:hypothetical protein